MGCCSATNDSKTAWLSDCLTPITLEDVAQSDIAVAYFVAGYIGRSIAWRRKCSACKEILVASNDGSPLQVCVPDEHKPVFEMVNRGEQSIPSIFCFTFTALAEQYYKAIVADKMKLQRMLAQPNQLRVFVPATTIAVRSTATLRCLLDVTCSAEHQNFKLLVETAFNCLVKYQLKRLNSRPMADEPSKKMLRKVRKLTTKDADLS